MKLTKEYLNELFEYRDGALYWKVKKGSATPGKKVGCPDTNGRLQVKIDGVHHGVHRIIWAMFNDDVPEKIDHKDNDYLNNRLENLRAATSSDNNKNARKRSDNKSGIKGIHWSNRNGKWCAQLWVCGKRKHLGYFDDIKDAEFVIRKERETHHGEFANHG